MPSLCSIRVGVFSLRIPEKHHDYNVLGVRLTLDCLTRTPGKPLGRFMDGYKSEALLLMDGLDRLDPLSHPMVLCHDLPFEHRLWVVATNGVNVGNAAMIGPSRGGHADVSHLP